MRGVKFEKRDTGRWPEDTLEARDIAQKALNNVAAFFGLFTDNNSDYYVDALEDPQERAKIAAKLRS